MSDSEPFDLILANINRNVLLDEMPHYARHLASNGHLLLSGFYEEDLSLLREAAAAQKLVEVWNNSQDQWAVLLVRKR